MKQEIRHFYIDGDWSPASDNADFFVVENPANQQLVTRFALANTDDVNRAVQAARDALPAWSKLPVSERQQWLLLIAEEMEQRVDDLCAAHTDTMGCPVMHVEELHVRSPIDGLRKMAGLAECLADQQVSDEVLVSHEAAGVCALINPWNYPLHQLIGKLAPALLAGCTVVVKPAEQTPLQDLILAEIIHKVGLPAGVFNLLFGTGETVGSALASHWDVDLVSFTGSCEVGRQVSHAAAHSVKKVCLELGGKSPLIITEDADLAAAVSFGIENVMLNSGQTCDALTRMLVPRAKQAEVEALAIQAVEALLLGDPQNPEVFIGPLCNRKQQQRVRGFIQQGMESGAKLLSGGLELPVRPTERESGSLESGAFVAPTVFSEVTPDMSIAKQEIFGPVVCIMFYEHIEQAIAIANDTEYGLSSGVYASDYASALNIARKIRAGQTYLQGAYFNYDAPFGGFKQSGIGREWTEAGLMEYTETHAFLAPQAS